MTRPARNINIRHHTLIQSTLIYISSWYSDVKWHKRKQHSFVYTKGSNLSRSAL